MEDAGLIDVGICGDVLDDKIAKKRGVSPQPLGYSATPLTVLYILEYRVQVSLLPTTQATVILHFDPSKSNIGMSQF